jgi:hypothetical protein
MASVNISFAESETCKFFNYCGGSGHQSKSLPSNSAATSLNPSNVSSVKGYGLETVYQRGNPLSFNFVSGNGKIGALVSPTLENSFFGNRSIEIDDLNHARKVFQKQYKNSKLNLAVGAKVLENKNFDLSLGLSIKRNPEIKNINPGVGVSGTFAFLHFGAYFYQDDVKIDLANYLNPYSQQLYSSIYHSNKYQEKFSVETYTMGTSIGNFSSDIGLMKTRYKFYQNITRIYLYSLAYRYNKFLYNYSLRKEDSDNLTYRNGAMIFERKKTDAYLGVQYEINRFFTVGLQHNNFLLNESSFTLILFF